MIFIANKLQYQGVLLLRAIFIGFSALTFVISEAQGEELYLRSLTGLEAESFKRLQKQGKIFILFKPDCLPCRKQIQDLSCLSPKNIVLIGSFSSEDRLRKEILKMRTDIPSYYIARKDLWAMGIKDEVTPQIFTKSRGAFIRGYLRCESIKEKLNISK